VKEIERYLNLEIPQGQSIFLWGARNTGNNQSQEIISHLSSVKAADKSLKKEGASSLIALFQSTHLFFFLSSFLKVSINQKALHGSLRDLFYGDHYD
jgi:hypothetical protein